MLRLTLMTAILKKSGGSLDETQHGVEIDVEKAPWITSFKSPDKFDDNGHIIPLLSYNSHRKRIHHNNPFYVPVNNRKYPPSYIYKQSTEEEDSEETLLRTTKKQ